MTWSCLFLPVVAGSPRPEPHVVLFLLSVSGLHYLSLDQSQLLLCKRACPKFNTITRKEKRQSTINWLGRTCNFIPPPWYKGKGGGWWNPSPEFLICCSISKRFCLQWKAFDLLNKMSYNLWVVALRAGGLWRHQIWSPSWPPSWILPRIRSQVKI